MRTTPFPKRLDVRPSRVTVKIFVMGANYVQLVNQKRYSSIQLRVMSEARGPNRRWLR